VVTLNNPALRERGDDLSLLAQHFLNKFSKQFETEKKYLAPETLQSMQRYPWPGNIRELENKLMQATLLSENAEITLEELNLEMEASEYDSSYGSESDFTDLTDSQSVSYDQLNEPQDNLQNFNQSEEIKEQSKEQATEKVDSMSEPEAQDDISLVSNKPYQDARQQDPQVIDLKPSHSLLNQQKEVETLLRGLFHASLLFLNEIRNQAAFIHLSIGNCVEDELLVLTYQACNGNMRDVSTRLQLPTSTARRRVNKILLNLQSQTIEKPASWNEVKSFLQPIAEAKVYVPDCFDTIKHVLLEAILKSEPDNMSMAAALLGVSEPTFYKLKKQNIKLA
jgi:DNA-binding NtrC family response regulator